MTLIHELDLKLSDGIPAHQNEVSGLRISKVRARTRKIHSNVRRKALPSQPRGKNGKPLKLSVTLSFRLTTGRKIVCTFHLPSRLDASYEDNVEQNVTV